LPNDAISLSSGLLICVRRVARKRATEVCNIIIYDYVDADEPRLAKEAVQKDRGLNLPRLSKKRLDLEVAEFSTFYQPFLSQDVFRTWTPCPQI
jgi:hypothetical protein